MKRTISCWLIAVSVLAAAPVVATDSPPLGIGMGVAFHVAENPAPNSLREELVFTDEHARVKLELYIRAVRRGADADAERAVSLPSSDWTGLLTWTLFDRENGKQTSLTGVRTVSVWVARSGRHPSRDHAQELYEGDVWHAWVELPLLPAGDYYVLAELNAQHVADESDLVHATSDKTRITVATGDETEAIHRAYLWATADRIAATPSPDRYPRFRDTMLDLAKYDPSPTVFERLGDISAGIAPIPETLRYYERAFELTQAALARTYGSTLPEDAKAYWEQRRRSLTAFSRSVKAYLDAGPDARIDIINERGEKRIAIYKIGDKRATIVR